MQGMQGHVGEIEAGAAQAAPRSDVVTGQCRQRRVRALLCAFALLAIIPGAGGTQRLPRLVGRARAKDLIFTGRRVGAAEALEMNLVDRRAARGEALQCALELARQILPNGPVALRAAKEAIDSGLDLERDQAMALEASCYRRVLPTRDRLEGLAAFKEKRKPVYQGR